MLLGLEIRPEKIELRRRWISLISRKDFTPTKGHRVCSEHCPGGQKDLHEQYTHHSAKDNQAHYFQAKKTNTVEEPRSKRSMEVSFSKQQPDASNAAESESDNGYELAVLKAQLDCLKLKHEEKWKRHSKQLVCYKLKIN